MPREDARIKYPWNEWLDGKEHIHQCENPLTFRNYLYGAAKRKDVYVSIQIDIEGVRFKFFDTDEEYKEGKFNTTRARGSRGTFLTPLEPTQYRYCTVCNKPLNGSCPPDKQECYKFFDGDFRPIHI